MDPREDKTELLNAIMATGIKTVFCERLDEALSKIHEEATRHGREVTVVAHEWATLPQVDRIIRDVLDSLATIALRMWPSWYALEPRFQADCKSIIETAISDSKVIDRLVKSRRNLSTSWLRAAVENSRKGKIPLFDTFTPAIQASQLSLAIEPRELVLALVVEDTQPQTHALFGLSKACEWLARETGANIVVLIPSVLSRHAEIETLAYEALSVSAIDHNRQEEGTSDELKHVVWPTPGRPHPFSPGEMLLAKRLKEDADLGALFKFNERVKTVRDSIFMVDLVWVEGKIAVEIDGYRYHSNRYSFGFDRHRDYELTISGFLTLRIPHHEVMRDPDIALDKIRDLVAFRKADFFEMRRNDYEL